MARRGRARQVLVQAGCDRGANANQDQHGRGREADHDGQTRRGSPELVGKQRTAERTSAIDDGHWKSPSSKPASRGRTPSASTLARPPERPSTHTRYAATPGPLPALQPRV